MDLEIAGRKALVTGADSGIAYATARELLAEGAMVILTDRDPHKLAAAVASLQDNKGQMHSIVADITRPESVQALEQEVTVNKACIPNSVVVTLYEKQQNPAPIQEEPSGCDQKHKLVHVTK